MYIYIYIYIYISPDGGGHDEVSETMCCIPLNRPPYTKNISYADIQPSVIDLCLHVLFLCKEVWSLM